MINLDSKTKNIMLIATYILFLAFALLNIKSIGSAILWSLGILSPFIIGFAIAFVLNIPMKLFEKHVLFFLDNSKSSFVRNMKRPLSITLSLLSIIGLIITLTIFVIPQLVDSVSTLVASIPGYMKNFEDMVQEFMNSNDIFNDIWADFLTKWKDFLQTAGQILAATFTHVLSITVNITASIVNFVISLIFSIYMLANKENLLHKIRRLLTAYTPAKFVDKVYHVGAIANKSFTKFISGQCTEAVIIGTLCFIGMLLLKLPYALLISSIVALTSLIPIIGAFIGTAPGIFIILMIDPIKALVFLIFIIVLQQFEGNLIYPKVVGNSIGLSAIWVLLAMTIGGATFGILGMLLGIPSFGVIYQLIKENTNKRLDKKNIRLN